MNDNVAVYSTTYCRGSKSTETFEVAASLIDAAFAARSEYAKTFEVPDWVEDITHYETEVLIATIIEDTFGNITPEMNVAWNETRILAVESEETSFGVGPTLKDAKLAWVDLD